MSKIKVLGGTVNRRLNWVYSFGSINGHDPSTFSQKIVESCRPKDLKELTVADQASGVKVMGAVGWGTVGTLIAGPLGAVVGGVIGGRGETITFVAEFPNGKTMMGQVPKKEWLKMLAARMS